MNRVGGPVHDFPSDIMSEPGLSVVIALGLDS